MSTELIFRESFKLPAKLTKWFPGHMNRGLAAMQRLAKATDCFIEIHDARIPFSGRNPLLRESLSGGVKPHILVLNKRDLADLSPEGRKKDIEGRLLSQRGANHVLWTNCLEDLSSKRSGDGGGYEKLIISALKLIRSTPNRYNRADSSDLNCMIVGIPNVGKSTMINKLRRLHSPGKGGNPARTGALPGFTKAVHEKIKINANPPVYLFDTPGVMEPQYGRDLHQMLKVAIVGCLDDDTIDLRPVSDYLLFRLNRARNFNYVNFLGLDKPTDSIDELLVRTSVANGFTNVVTDIETKNHRRVPNLKSSMLHFLNAFRRGEFGPFFLDEDYLR